MCAPCSPDPVEAPTLRWGVLGSGWIAERFVHSVQRHTRQCSTAVASRDIQAMGRPHPARVNGQFAAVLPAPFTGPAAGTSERALLNRPRAAAG